MDLVDRLKANDMKARARAIRHLDFQVNKSLLAPEWIKLCPPSRFRKRLDFTYLDRALLAYLRMHQTEGLFTEEYIENRWQVCVYIGNTCIGEGVHRSCSTARIRASREAFIKLEQRTRDMEILINVGDPWVV